MFAIEPGVYCLAGVCSVPVPSIAATSATGVGVEPALVAAGIIPNPTKGERGRLRYVTTRKEGMHQLRHYYASVILADGVNIRELAEYLGHADPGFTLRILRAHAAGLARPGAQGD